VTNFVPVEKKLSRDRLIELIEKINDEMGKNKISYRDLFDKFDTDHDNMVSLAEFTNGVTSLLSIAAPFAEQLYAVMDKRGIGLINYN
jgi:Ca2+-binding EF-hand superfamily protein